MSFFSRLSNVAASAVSKVVQYATNSGAPHDVIEIKPADTARMTVLAKEECMTLYRDGQVSNAVLYCPGMCPKAYSLFRVQCDGEAMILFVDMAQKLLPFYGTTKRMYDEEILQNMCTAIRKYPSWSTAHLAAAVGLPECLGQKEIKVHLDSICEISAKTPIVVAVESDCLECIQELLILGADLNLADKAGDNVFHHAARTKNPQIVKYLASKDKSGINQLNLEGESALHVACINDKPDHLEQLLRWGADQNLTMSGRYPIHCAMKKCSVKCVETLIKWNKSQLNIPDGNYGGSPLHWAKTKECVYLLADLGANLEARNKSGVTPLLVMADRNRFDALMALLAKGADACAVGNNGYNALHLAIKHGCLELIKALIVFGADVNGVNHIGETPRHIAGVSANPDKEGVVYCLHKVGAKRCNTNMTGCAAGCSFDGTFDGNPPCKEVINPSSPVHKQSYDKIVNDIAMAAAMTRSNSATGSAIMQGDNIEGTNGIIGERVLCLDGGGIRGLILIQILLALEKSVGAPIHTCFDWVSGTSTGGILALALTFGKSVRYCQGLYFRLKDEVFCGKRPYPSEPLEQFMKKEFGEHTRMSEVEHPKVLVSGVFGDRFPSELHFFRNFEPPGQDFHDLKKKSRFEMPPRPTDQYVWRAARSSGAAPTYFRAMGRFLDGGLIANNPTLDTMTEIHEYNMGLKATRQEEKVRPMHVVVSLGTGKIPVKEVKSCDVYRPEGILDLHRVAHGAMELTNLLIDQATASEGRPVDRAKAWCSMIGVPFFRFSPQLSDDIGLDCKDNKLLIQMLWETQCYLYEERESIHRLGQILRKF